MRNHSFYRLSILSALLFIAAGCALSTPTATTSPTIAPTGDSAAVTPDAVQDSPLPPTATDATPEPAAQGGPASGVSQVAERVEFEDGASTATISGTLPAGGEMQYAFTGVASQSIHVQSVGYSAPVSFTVYAPDNSSWTGEPQAAGVHIFTSLFTLPVTGDYLVILSVPSDTSETAYDVTFTLAASTTLPMTPQPDPAERIFFDPQTGSAERSGLMPTGLGVQQYVLNVNADQTLTIDAMSDGAPLSMTIESPSGNQWIPEMVQTDDGYTIGHQFTLPEPGYYLVTLTKGDHTPSTNYTITFTLQP